ncbi:MAG: SDR family oxidoreductase [Acidobacteria bacterium]|nr:SDR family oxidoreductase [Acidobacteriota bacterium]
MSTVLLITGCSGIAEAAALLAAERGWRVFLSGLDEELCQELSKRIPGAGYSAGDLREEENAERVCARAIEQFGRIDALFNVAGISGRPLGDGPLHECTAKGWDATMSANVRSTFLMSRPVLNRWLERGQPGAILNMASVLAFSPESRFFAAHAYAASKGAVISLTKAMAAYYAPHGIRVNAIAPGLVRTPMSLRAQSNEEILDFIRRKQPLSEAMLEAEDVARAALFLLGGESRHITGEVMTVDAGWSVTG